MKEELEKIAKQINTLVNKKVRNKTIDITHPLDTIINNIHFIKKNIESDLEGRFADYLILKCYEFKISVDVKQHKFSFQCTASIQ